MAAWGEGRGALFAVVCEHHGMADGYLPSPLILATALAARTTTLPIMVAVVVLPLYQPIRLAEDMAVLDILSRGRVSYVAAVGYVPHEYEQHGVDFHSTRPHRRRRASALAQGEAGRALRARGPADPCDARSRSPPVVRRLRGAVEALPRRPAPGATDWTSSRRAASRRW